MGKHNQVSKKQLLKVIDSLEESPSDRVRILGDIGITSLGIGLGAAAAGTVATIAGVTAVPMITTAASLAGGALAFGVSRLIRNGGLSEGRKLELLQIYRERLQEIQRLEAAQKISASERNEFISSIREVIEKDALSPKKAFELIEAVERGAIPLSQAYSLVLRLLEDN
jgi:hypothetical protein